MSGDNWETGKIEVLEVDIYLEKLAKIEVLDRQQEEISHDRN